MRRIIPLSSVDGKRGLASRECRIARRNMPIPDGSCANLSVATATAAVWEGRVVKSDMGYDVITGSLVLPVTRDAPCDDLISVYGLPETPVKRHKTAKRWGDPRQLDDDFVW